MIYKFITNKDKLSKGIGVVNIPADLLNKSEKNKNRVYIGIGRAINNDKKYLLIASHTGSGVFLQDELLKEIIEWYNSAYNISKENQ